MPKTSPWSKVKTRQAPRTLPVEMPSFGTTRLRALEWPELMQVLDRADEYVGRYVTGAGNADGKPGKLMAPTVPPQSVPMSRRLCNIIAQLEAMEVPEEGEEPWGIIDWAGVTLSEPDWQAVLAVFNELDRDPRGNPAGASPTITNGSDLPNAPATPSNSPSAPTAKGRKSSGSSEPSAAPTA
jgi:hypothetical protein